MQSDKHHNSDPNIWVVYSKVPKRIWNEFKDLGLVPQLDEIIKTALEEAIYLEKGRK